MPPRYMSQLLLQIVATIRRAGEMKTTYKVLQQGLLSSSTDNSLEVASTTSTATVVGDLSNQMGTTSLIITKQ